MKDLDFYIKQINHRLNGSALFYITNDPERGIGLEGLLQNYYIVALDDSDIYTNIHFQHGNIFSLENKEGDLNAIFRSSAKLLDEPTVKEYIENNSEEKGKKLKRYFQTFKISSAFEQRAKAYNAEILNTSSELNQKFENKISQYTELSKNGANFPKTIISKLEDIDYKKLKKELGNKFVVQFNRGHTGTGTKVINQKEEYKNLQKIFPERTARITEYVRGLPYTINACVGKMGVFAGGLNYQITGVPELAPSQGATVGNDFSFRQGIDKEIQKKIYKQVQLIGKTMKAHGYIGLFGLDLIVQSDKVFVIEVNARQPASVPMYTKLQLMAGEIPLSLIHIGENLGVHCFQKPEIYSERNMKPINAGQIFLRNQKNEPFLIKGRVKSGVYKLKGKSTDQKGLNIDENADKMIVLEKEAYNISEIENGGFLLLTQLNGKRVNPTNELARIQSLQPIVDKKGLPMEWYKEVLTSIEQYYH